MTAADLLPWLWGLCAGLFGLLCAVIGWIALRYLDGQSEQGKRLAALEKFAAHVEIDDAAHARAEERLYRLELWAQRVNERQKQMAEMVHLVARQNVAILKKVSAPA